MTEERPDPFRRRPRPPANTGPGGMPPQPPPQAAGGAVTGTVAVATPIYAEPGGPEIGWLDAGTVLWLFEHDTAAQVLRVSTPEGTRGWVRATELDYDPVLVPVRQAHPPLAPPPPPPAPVYDPPTRVSPPSPPRAVDPPTRITPPSAPAPAYGQYNVPQPQPAPAPPPPPARVEEPAPRMATPARRAAAPQAGPGQAPYEYHVVPFIGQIRGGVFSKDNAETVSAQLSDVIAAVSRQGWEFYRIDQVQINYKPGCLGFIFGSRSAVVSFDQVIFRRRLA